MELEAVFAVNLKKFRKRACLTQEKLAELCGTEPAYIGQIETGRRCPSLSCVEKIAFALKVAPYRLFYDESAPDADAAPRLEQKQKLKNILIESVEHICALIDENY